MTSLTFAVVFWVLLHFVVAGPLRPALAARLRERGFQGMFSLLSLVGLVWLSVAYGHAPEQFLWAAPPGARTTAMILVFIACLFFAYSVSGGNVTMVAVADMPQDHIPVAGITRITRDPMLWSFALWAIAHLL